MRHMPSTATEPLQRQPVTQTPTTGDRARRRAIDRQPRDEGSGQVLQRIIMAKSPSKITGHTARHLIFAAILAAVLVVCLQGTGLPATAEKGYSRSHYVLPPEIAKEGFSFVGVPIPLGKRDVAARITDQLNFLLMDRRAMLMDWFDRLTEFGPTIRAVLAQEKVPPDLIYLAILLGDLSPRARTRAGGVGWWALGPPKGKSNPATLPWVATDNWDDRRDPVISTKLASSILKGILQRNPKNNWLTVIASFADGADKIDAIMNKAAGYSFWDVVMPPYSEILIPRLAALKLIDRHRSYYGVEVPPLRPLAFDSLDHLKLAKDLPLPVVARWCGIPPRTLWALNPGVDPGNGVLPKADRKGSGFPLRVPAGKGRKVMALLQKEGYVGK
jgi:hypothetical protein